MKRTCLLFTLALIAVVSSFAQTNFIDVVELHNGSIIRGIITEQTPGENLKIQTADGSLFVYPMSDVKKITKEQSTVSKKTLIQQLNEERVAEIRKMHLDSGYLGTFNIDYVINTGDYKKMMNVAFTTVQGYQFNPYLFAGFGTGVGLWGVYGGGKIDVNFPLFGDIRVTPLKNWVTPMLEIRCGYAVGKIDGFYFNPVLGVHFCTDKLKGVAIGVGYQMQKMDGVSEIQYDNYGNVSYKNTKVSCHGINIRVTYEW